MIDLGDVKNLAEVTVAHGQAPTPENAAETTMWIVEQGGCRGVFHAMDEADLQRILVHPATMIASDGEVPILRARGRNVDIVEPVIGDAGDLQIVDKAGLGVSRIDLHRDAPYLALSEEDLSDEEESDEDEPEDGEGDDDDGCSEETVDRSRRFFAARSSVCSLAMI